MKKADILTLFAYNEWANERVLAAAARVAPEQLFAAVGLTYGSLMGALVHVLAAEVVWRMRIAEGVSPPALLIEENFDSLDALVARWQEEREAMRTFLAGLTDEALSEPVRYRTTKGEAHENTLWQLLVHVVNHGTQFRAEAAVALTNDWQSPGDLDFIAFLREQA
jgi:uncharacterized damage-inducible protein DinB